MAVTARVLDLGARLTAGDLSAVAEVQALAALMLPTGTPTGQPTER